MLLLVKEKINEKQNNKNEIQKSVSNLLLKFQ